MDNTMQDAKCHALTGGLDPYFVILRLHRCSFRAFPWYRLGILSQIISNFYALIDPLQSDETLVMLTTLIFVGYGNQISEPTTRPFEPSLQDLHRTAGVEPVEEGDILAAQLQRGKYVYGQLLPKLGSSRPQKTHMT